MRIADRPSIPVAVACLAALGCARGEPLRPLDHGWRVDPGARTVEAFVDLDRAPDFTTRDALGRMADQLQYWFDSRSGVDAWAAGMRRNAGVPVDGTQTLLSWSDAAAGELVVLRIEAVAPGVGWGPEIGRVPFAVDAANRLSFALPWTLLGSADGSFSSTFETYAYGGWGGGQWSTPPAIPEAPPWALLLVGALVLAAAPRRRVPAR